MHPAFMPERGLLVLPGSRAARLSARHQQPAGKEAMSLTGLIGAVATGSQLRNALDYVSQPGAGDADLVAPVGLRPILIAALAGAARQPDGQSSEPQTPLLLAITATPLSPVPTSYPP